VDDLADITLNGDPFFLVPGGYVRSAENPAPAEPGRLKLARFERGLGIAYDDSPGDEAAGGWSGAAVHSGNDGAGVEPWPFMVAHTDAALVSAPVTTVRIGAIAAGGNVYIHNNTRLYRTVAVTATSWSNLTAVQTTTGPIFDLGYFRDDVLVAIGMAQDIIRWQTLANAGITWRAGLKGHFMQGYAGAMLFGQVNAAVREIVFIGGTATDGTATLDSRWLDSPIVRMGMFEGAAVIATQQSMFKLSGHSQRVAGAGALWDGEPEPLFSHGFWVNTQAGDFVFLLSLAGKLYTWLAGGVMEHDPGSDGWRPVGPRGRNCYGACVAADHLLVAIETSDERSQLWAFDGVGWWLIVDTAAPGLIWPCALSGAGSFDFIVFTHNSTTYRLGRLVPRSAANHAYHPTASWTSPLLTAGNVDTTKAWRQLVANFSAPMAPGNPSSVDSVTAYLDYSLDAGETWTQAATVTTGIDRTVEISHVFSAPPISRLLQLRVRWESVVDWAPILTSLVVDFATIDTAPRRQQWKLDVAVPDQLTGSGRITIEELWDAWRLGTSVVFRDIDYGSNPVERSVRILDIEESAPGAPRGGQGTDGLWSGGVVTLTISEV
jgi:hypothetical protein